MTEYITKEQALEAVRGKMWPGELEAAIKAVPPADVVKVAHGRWEAQEVGPINAYKCSNCGLITINRNIPLLRYCERCGAIMDGGESK